MRHKIHPAVFDPIIQDVVHRHPNEIKKYKLYKLVENYPMEIYLGKEWEHLRDKFGRDFFMKIMATMIIDKASNVVVKYENKLYLIKSRCFTTVEDEDFGNCHSFGWMFLNTDFSYVNSDDATNLDNYINLVKSLDGLLIDLDYPYTENVLEATDTTTSE